MTRYIIYIIALAQVVAAANLPQSLTAVEIDRITEVLVQAAPSRLMRSAEPYTLFPGIKVGLETVIIPTKDLNSLGNGKGTLPSLMPVPRLYLCKGLVYDTDLILNLFPSSAMGTLSSFGTMVKWTFSKEQDEKWMSSAAYIGFTTFSGFDGAFSGKDFEVGVVASKDYVRLKPYAGAGILVANGSILPSFAKTSVTSSWQPTFRGFIGTEWLLPIVDIAGQLDFMNMAVSMSFFIGKKI